METIIETMKKSCIIISNEIKSRNLLQLGSETNNKNASNEAVKELDILSNNIIKNNLVQLDAVSYIASEEEDELIHCNNKNNYLVSYDPLDGSSNIDVSITVGTIFGIYDYNDGNYKIVCAGYGLYGSQTQFVLAYNNSISFYQLNDNKFELIKDNLKIPNKGKIVSMNLSYNKINLDKKYEELCNKLFDEGYTQRFVGSLVADAHRTLLKGGIFMYPANNKSQKGKIRLLYEAVPFAYIFEIAGGCSSNGEKSLLDVDIYTTHQRTPIILSSRYEFSRL